MSLVIRVLLRVLSRFAGFAVAGAIVMTPVSAMLVAITHTLLGRHLDVMNHISELALGAAFVGFAFGAFAFGLCGGLTSKRRNWKAVIQKTIKYSLVGSLAGVIAGIVAGISLSIITNLIFRWSTVEDSFSHVGFSIIAAPGYLIGLFSGIALGTTAGALYGMHAEARESTGHD